MKVKAETNIKRWLSILLLAAVCNVSFAVKTSENEKRVKTVLQSWTLTDGLAVPDSQQVDTSFIDYPMHDAINNYSIANSYNGNMVSPLQSKIYFDRTEKSGFLFARPYEAFLLTSKDVRYFNTNTPYSTIAYKKGFVTYHENNDLDFSFTGNVNKRLNLGITLNYLTGIGMYRNQSAKRFAGSVFGSYRGNHYSCQGTVTFNTLSNFENGGITDEDDLTRGVLNSYDIPVNLSSGGMSGLKYVSAYWNHRYSICVERERKETIKPPRGSDEEPRDTIMIDYIPVTTFLHTFEVNHSTKRYVEQTAQQGYFDNNYFNTSQTTDTAAELSIKNTLAVTFEEEFNKWLHFGATVYAMNEFVRYSTAVPDYLPPFTDMFGNSISFSNTLILHTDTLTAEKWTNNTWVGGSLYKNQGKWVRYGFNGDVCVVGYKIGEFQVNGHVNGEFKLGKDTMTIKAKAYLKNEQPDYFVQHYMSNHYCWSNDFQKIYRFYVGGQLAYPMKYIQPSVDVGFENITRFIYFDENGLPQQHNGNIQVLSVDAQLNIRTRYFAMDNHVIYQLSSSEYLPLPTIALYHNMYYKDCWFKALNVQFGVDMRYNTAYYAPLLNPATGQFCIQNTQKVGNYPILNVYANFYVKPIKLKLFAQFTHFNQYFMNKQYYSMPNYPYNPPIFRAGLAWHFYN